MNEIVLDASVILAIFFQEPGPDLLPFDFQDRALLSTVNLAEAQTKLLQRGFPPDLAWKGTLALIAKTVQFSEDHARIAGDLILQTHSLGLSLGDRICLATAALSGYVAVTADRTWAQVGEIQVEVIR